MILQISDQTIVQYTSIRSQALVFFTTSNRVSVYIPDAINTCQSEHQPLCSVKRCWLNDFVISFQEYSTLSVRLWIPYSTTSCRRSTAKRSRKHFAAVSWRLKSDVRVTHVYVVTTSPSVQRLTSRWEAETPDFCRKREAWFTISRCPWPVVAVAGINITFAAAKWAVPTVYTGMPVWRKAKTVDGGPGRRSYCRGRRRSQKGRNRQWFTRTMPRGCTTIAVWTVARVFTVTPQATVPPVLPRGPPLISGRSWNFPTWSYPAINGLFVHELAAHRATVEHCFRQWPFRIVALLF